MKFARFLMFAIGLSGPVLAAGADGNAMPVMGSSYRSVFSDYRVYRQIEMGDWREANEKAGGMGSHAGHGMSHEGRDMGDMHGEMEGHEMPDHSGHGGH